MIILTVEEIILLQEKLINKTGGSHGVKVTEVEPRTPKI